MNFLRNAATRYVTQYKQAYLETGRFRPVVHVMWVIGISGFVYEGYHHHHLEKLHTQAAEHKKIELKQAHSEKKWESLPPRGSAPVAQLSGVA